MHLDSFNTITSDGSKYLVATFNTNTRKIIYVVCVYRVHSCSIFTFLKNIQTIIQQSHKHCPITIMGDFNVDILKDNNQPKNKQELLYCMDTFQLKSQFNENTTKFGSQLNHTWANVCENECKSSVIEAYWSNFHKSILYCIQITKHNSNV